MAAKLRKKGGGKRGFRVWHLGLALLLFEAQGFMFEVPALLFNVRQYSPCASLSYENSRGRWCRRQRRLGS